MHRKTISQVAAIAVVCCLSRLAHAAPAGGFEIQNDAANGRPNCLRVKINPSADNTKKDIATLRGDNVTRSNPRGLNTTQRVVLPGSPKPTILAWYWPEIGVGEIILQQYVRNDAGDASYYCPQELSLFATPDVGTGNQNFPFLFARGRGYYDNPSMGYAISNPVHPLKTGLPDTPWNDFITNSGRLINIPPQTFFATVSAAMSYYRTNSGAIATLETRMERLNQSEQGLSSAALVRLVDIQMRTRWWLPSPLTLGEKNGFLPAFCPSSRTVSNSPVPNALRCTIPNTQVVSNFLWQPIENPVSDLVSSLPSQNCVDDPTSKNPTCWRSVIRMALARTQVNPIAEAANELPDLSQNPLDRPMDAMPTPTTLGTADFTLSNSQPGTLAPGWDLKTTKVFSSAIEAGKPTFASTSKWTAGAYNSNQFPWLRAVTTNGVDNVLGLPASTLNGPHPGPSPTFSFARFATPGATSAWLWPFYAQFRLDDMDNPDGRGMVMTYTVADQANTGVITGATQ